MASTTKEIEFLDFGNSAPYDHENSFYDQLMMLFSNLKKTSDEGEASFWPNREKIACDTSGLVIALDDCSRQLAFCYISKDENPNIISVLMIQSFDKLKGYATKLLDHVLDVHTTDGVAPLMLVRDIVEDAVPFWDRYFAHNLRSGDFSWYVNPKAGMGPLMDVKERITYGDLLSIVESLEERLGMTITPLERTEGGLQFFGGDLEATHEFTLMFPLIQGRINWEFVKVSWRSDWRNSTKRLMLPGKYKTRIICNPHFRFEILDVLKDIFKSFEIDLRYIYQ